MDRLKGRAEVRVETVVIPTYGVGEPDKNPMFLEKRVYQGSSGKVYPLPVIDKILDRKEDKAYTGIWLENEYIRVLVLPELGGRIQRAQDKTNGYDFVYYNEVIKPALVGLTGPWISGGIEFNWPQHHRPTTFSPVDWEVRENPDGSCSADLSEVDQMYGTKGRMTFTICPGKAYIEVRGQLYNRTPLPQTFLWWANPAVAANDDTQSVFPPDVTAVFDHGKRAVSAFPIATGVYYKHDYSAGVDISRYRNIPVPTSYMCARSDYDFVGGYDYGAEAGILHVADHHVSPGKKQWTWGCGDFGKAWDRNLTDRNGPYVELMTGVYCDNQPDFTWLRPFEEKTFTQYFMPYKKAGYVKNANREAAVNLEREAGTVRVTVYATGAYPQARILLTEGGPGGGALLDRAASLSPAEVFSEEVATEAADLFLAVLDRDGRRIISWRTEGKREEEIPEPMAAAKAPAEIGTVEELYLTGLHLEQYRHATFLPDDYYGEALRRDPGDIRTNNAFGTLKLRRGQFAEAEAHFRKAVGRMTERNPNPFDGEAFLNLGLALVYQGREAEAYDAFFKATWSAAQQEAGYYWLAALACRRGEYAMALDFAERALVRNSRNVKARSLKGLILESLGLHGEAEAWFGENLRIDPFDYVSMLESGETEKAARMMGDRVSSYIEAALDYAEAGYYADSVDILDRCPAEHPMALYHRARFLALSGDCGEAARTLRKAAEANPLYCFPNRPEDIAALTFAMDRNGEDPRAPYYLGCLYYDRRRWEDAVRLWERSAELDPSFPTVWRNLALAYFNKAKDPQKAREALERAYSLDEGDSRVLLELDQLYHRLNVPLTDRLAFLEARRETVFRRDDLTVEFCALLNSLGRYEEALDIIRSRRFHPWEGGEGRVTGQYAFALKQLARGKLKDGDMKKAAQLLHESLSFPENLGEGKLEGAKDNDIHYLLGLALKGLGEAEKARKEFERAAEGNEEPVSALYYNDQPPEMILYEALASRELGDEDRARKRLDRLISYGEEHLEDEIRPDYFAVSLPDLQLFEADLKRSNRAHCEYMMGLGCLGLGETEKAAEHLEKVLAADNAHQGAITHRALL